MGALPVLLTRINDLLSKVVKAAVVLMAVAMVGAILWQISMRYLFQRPPSWTEELALLLFSWSMLLMLAVGVREMFHVRVDLLLEALPARGQRCVQFVLDLMIAGFGAYLMWSGIEYNFVMYGTTSAAIAYPMVVLYSAAPVCGGLVFLFSLEHLLGRHSEKEQK